MEKQKELKDPDARYLLVCDADGSTVAYVHFRYACSLLLSFKTMQVSMEAMQAVMHMLMALKTTVHLLIVLPTWNQEPPSAISMKVCLLAISRASKLCL